MRYPANSSPFTNQELVVHSSGLLHDPRVFQNGGDVYRGKGGTHTVRSESGAMVSFKLRTLWWDPIPQVKLGDQTILLTRALTLFENTWLLIPFCFLCTFGAIGAFSGVFLSILNGRILRSDRSAFVRYGQSAGLTVAVTLATIVVGVTAVSLMGAWKK